MKKKREQPSYFAIIPANVRYSKIPDRAKLLFGEITALAQKEGYCFASNTYFAEAYNCSPQAISRHISILEQAGFLRIDHNKDAGNLRKIWPIMDAVTYQPVVDSSQPRVESPLNHELRPYQPAVKQNSTRVKEQEIKESESARENSTTFHVELHSLETIPNDGGIHRAAPDTPDWMEVAKAMLEYSKGEGATQYQFMATSMRFKGDPMPIFVTWAGKASEYQLRNWKKEFPKLGTWFRNEAARPVNNNFNAASPAKTFREL